MLVFFSCLLTNYRALFQFLRTELTPAATTDAGGDAKAESEYTGDLVSQAIHRLSHRNALIPWFPQSQDLLSLRRKIFRDRRKQQRTQHCFIPCFQPFLFDGVVL